MKRVSAVLWLFAAVLLLASCGEASEDSGSSEKTSETRTVEHALGTSEAPERPQRIVSLSVGEITDTLIALDHKPVGSATYDPVADAYVGSGNNGAYPPALAGEHIFAISYDLENTSFEELIQRPLWSQITAVKEGRVYPVQGVAWTNHGPLGAMLLIDEVESALTG